MARVLLTLLCIALAACSCQAQSGSGSGQGGVGGQSCAALNCSYMCNESALNGPVCVCKVDYMLQADGSSCAPCSAGMYGTNCSLSCSTKCGGRGRSIRCNTTSCECNSCYSGADCSTEIGSSCFIAYLEALNKDNLDVFGSEPPEPPLDSLYSLARAIVQEGTLEAAIQVDSVKLEVIDRSDVQARDLLRFSMDVTPGSTVIDNARNQVKTGAHRATLITDESSSDKTTLTYNV